MSEQRLLVIGGDAAGMTAASQARRRSSELDITAYERGTYTSYSAWGIPSPRNRKNPVYFVLDIRYEFF